MKETVIRRDGYLEILQKCRMNGFVKIITGIRRCGKSFLLNTLYRQFLLDDGVSASHIISIDLDDDERYGIKDDGALLSVLDILSSDIGSLTNPHRIVHVGVIPFLLDRTVLSELMKG